MRDLLAYTRITKFDKPAGQIDATLALESALQALGATISETNAKVVSVGSLPLLRVHFAHLLQLFQNLIGNAIKYRTPGTPPIVLVGAKRHTSYSEFFIQDNGIGVAPEKQRRSLASSNAYIAQKNIRAPAWAWRFANASSNSTMAAYG